MRFHDLTWPLLRKVPRDQTVVLAPIAACEQHSRHLPTYTDTLLVTAVAEGAEQCLPQQILLLPTQWFGASSHHLRFGATLSAEVDTHITLIAELLEPLLEDGYQRVLVLNGHGGNENLLPFFAQTQLEKPRDYVVYVLGLVGAPPGGPPQQDKLDMHAGESETSKMLIARQARRHIGCHGQAGGEGQRFLAARIGDRRCRLAYGGTCSRLRRTRPRKRSGGIRVDSSDEATCGMRCRGRRAARGQTYSA